MASNEYHFITIWRLEATPEEVTEILGDAEGLARWWPSVYLEVEREEPGDERGVGAVVRPLHEGLAPVHPALAVHGDGVRPAPWLPASRPSGDFVGRGIWTFEQVGDPRRSRRTTGGSSPRRASSAASRSS